jgi:hypothetical protein
MSMSKRTASKRTAKFVSALFASLLAGAPLTTVSHGAPGPGGDCLSGPNGVAPRGGHWYYRIDFPTKRHCWYVRDAEKLSQAAPSASADPVPPQAKAPPPHTVEDAYAALPLPRQRVEPQASVAAPPAGNATGAPNDQTFVASRWPDPAGVSSSAGPAPATSDATVNQRSSAAVAPPPAIAAVPLAAADASSKSQFGSIPMVLTVIMGALSVAGVMGSTIFRFGSKRWNGQPEMRAARRVNWNVAETDRLAPTFPRSEARMPRRDVPRDLRPADDPNRRIAEMLARLARSAAT